MSKTFLVLAVALVAAGCKEKSDGDGPAKPVDPPGPKPDLFGEAPDAGVRAPEIALGAHAYAKYCALCHGPEGNGYAADNAPSLVSSTFLETATDEFLVAGIRDGRPGTPMAAYGRQHGGPLSDETITQIIAFLRERAPARIALADRPPGDAARGKPIYDASCRVCHGDPDGAPAVAVKLWNPTLLATATDAFLRHAIVAGRPGTKMLPKGGAQLDDPQIDDVVAYIRSWEKTSSTPDPHADHNHGPVDPHAGHNHGEIPADVPTPKTGPLVIHAKGKDPTFTLKDGRFVPAADVAKAYAAKQKMIILDARAASEWKVNHIPGALASPYHAPELLDAIPAAHKDTWILAYCACPHHASGVVVDELRKRGFTKTAVIDEGITFWQQQGYPIEGTGAKAGTVKP